MKNYLKLIFVSFSLAFLTLFLGCSLSSVRNDTSQLKYTYSRLKVMDLDQMSQIMIDQAKEYKKSDDPESLKLGLLICLSRPDEDDVVEKIISTIRTPLEDHSLWESSVEELMKKSIEVIQDESASPTDQVTYSIVLENMISELRPDFIKQYKSPGFETRVIQKLAQSEIVLSSAAQSEIKLNLMKSSFSASAIAQKLLDRRDEFLKHEKAKTKEDKPDVMN